MRCCVILFVLDKYLCHACCPWTANNISIFRQRSPGSVAIHYGPVFSVCKRLRYGHMDVLLFKLFVNDYRCAKTVLDAMGPQKVSKAQAGVAPTAPCLWPNPQMSRKTGGGGARSLNSPRLFFSNNGKGGCPGLRPFG